MKKLLYVGHHLHLKTKSTVFLKDILRRQFDVTDLPVDPEDLAATPLNYTKADFDYVVIFQLDFLAPIFLAKGIATIVVPMFDGSENMPSRHWEFSNQAYFISFSLGLHLKILRAGGNSLLVKYFPEVKPGSSPRKFDRLDGFFWERRPDTGMNLSVVHRLIGEQLDSLHLHLAPDIKTLQSTNPKGVFADTKISISKWFENKSDLAKVMATRNIYFAPRLSEGIGMGFLEAMADGMVVFANDSNTHNEYISNWENGVLYNLGIQGPAQLERVQLQQMGAAAQQSMADGRRKWERQTGEILDWVHATPPPSVDEIPADVLAAEIPRAYSAGFNPYVQFLARNSSLIQKMSPGLDLMREINLPYIDLNDKPAISGDAAIISGREIVLGKSGTRKYLGAGWSHDEDEFVWIDGTSAYIRFMVNDECQEASELVLSCHSLDFDDPQRLAIVINGVLCDTIQVLDRKDIFRIQLRDSLRERNEIAFFSRQTASPNNEPRKLSVAVYSLGFD